MTTKVLAQQIDGINRMRPKGGATPTGLYDLLNAYVTAKGTIKNRPGTVRHADLPANTAGLVGFQGALHAFSASTAGTFPATDPPVVVHRLRHPTGGSAQLARVHAAFPFLGRLYVVAEFTDGVVRHYYLESPPHWTENQALNVGDRLQPTAANGFYYEVVGLAGGAAMPNAWRPNTEVTVGEFRQPSVYNGFKYEIILATGTAPYRTSNHEPVWPEENLATVLERRYITEPQEPPTDEPEAPPEPPPPSPPGDYGPYPPVRPPGEGPPTVIR